MLGRRLLHYEILEQLGQGGMGVVYKARDTHLERLVAIKVLPPDKTADVERKRRFVQEARAASALNHPNIITIHDISNDGGIDFIVMEYVAGKGLDQLIPRLGLPSGQMLKYAVQIASALAKAHSAGIIHRDLKPGNMMVGPDDHVKVLDFGLAKLTEMISPQDEATLSIRPQTEEGTILGTACYMSPEQAEGKPVDSRSDIFSFGAVMYEMITGRRAFQQETKAATMAAILQSEPKPVSAFLPEVPRDLERVVDRCLRKNPDRRYQTMADLRVALEDLKQESDSGKLAVAAPVTEVSSKQGRRWWAFTAAGVLVAVAALVGGVWLLKKGAVHPPPEVKRLTFDSRLALHPAISPDGKYVAFSSDRAGEANLDIWVQAIPGGEPVRLTKDKTNEDYPSFSSDGTTIAFKSEREGASIYSVPVLGGAPKLLTQNGTQLRYSPDGQRLSFMVIDRSGGEGAWNSAAFLMPAGGGERNELRTGLTSLSNPVWSPDAKRLLYAGVTDIFDSTAPWYIASASGGPPARIEPSAEFARFLTASTYPLAWMRNNRILFSYTSGDAVNLWMVMLSPDNRRVIGPPEQLTFGPGQSTDASVSDSGVVVFASSVLRSRLWGVPLGLKDAQSKTDLPTLITDRDFAYWPSLSDTGKLAYLFQRSNTWTLWLKDLPSGEETSLAKLEGEPHLVSTLINRAGTRVAYTTRLQSRSIIHTIPAEGGAPEKICEDCGQARSWSSDGRVMLSQEEVREGSKFSGYRIDRIDAVSGHKTVLLEKRGVFLFSPDLSPDGHWVAFQARETVTTNEERLFIAPMDERTPVAPERWIAITELKYFDADPMFARDGKTLYFTSDRDGFTCLWAVRLDPITEKPLGDPFPIKHFHVNPRHYSGYPQFCVGPDRIIISLDQLQSDLWMMQLPQ